MLYDSSKVSDNDDTLLNRDGIITVELKGDNLTQLLTYWENTLLDINETPSDSMLEGLLRKQLDKSKQLKNAISLCWQDITQRGEEKSYDKLLTILRSHIDRKRLDRNKASLDRGRHATPAAKPGTGKGTCHQWNEKGQCSRGANCPWAESHTKERAKSLAEEAKATAKARSEDAPLRELGLSLLLESQPVEPRLRARKTKSPARTTS